MSIHTLGEVGYFATLLSINCKIVYAKFNGNLLEFLINFH